MTQDTRDKIRAVQTAFLDMEQAYAALGRALESLPGSPPARAKIRHLLDLHGRAITEVKSLAIALAYEADVQSRKKGESENNPG